MKTFLLDIVILIWISMIDESLCARNFDFRARPPYVQESMPQSEENDLNLPVLSGELLTRGAGEFGRLEKRDRRITDWDLKHIYLSFSPTIKNWIISPNIIDIVRCVPHDEMADLGLERYRAVEGCPTRNVVERTRTVHVYGDKGNGKIQLLKFDVPDGCECRIIEK